MLVFREFVWVLDWIGFFLGYLVDVFGWNDGFVDGYLWVIEWYVGWRVCVFCNGWLFDLRWFWCGVGWICVFDLVWKRLDVVVWIEWVRLYGYFVVEGLI